MNHRKRFLASMLLAAVVLIFNGCANPSSKLEPGGAYAPAVTNTAGDITYASDPVLYIADLQFEFAHDTLDRAFLFERTHRDVLWQISPKIKHKLDELRVKAVEIKRLWATARQAYLTSPVPERGNALTRLLQEMQRMSAVAAAVVASELAIAEPQTPQPINPSP